MPSLRFALLTTLVMSTLRAAAGPADFEAAATQVVENEIAREGSALKRVVDEAIASLTSSNSSVDTQIVLRLVSAKEDSVEASLPCDAPSVTATAKYKATVVVTAEYYNGDDSRQLTQSTEVSVTCVSKDDAPIECRLEK